MGKWKRVWRYCFMPKGESIILFLSFFLTLFSGVAVGILAGVVLAAFLFIHRMSTLPYIRPEEHEFEFEDTDEMAESISIYHVDGPFFFGASSRLKTILDEYRSDKKVVILDFRKVPLIDSTGLWVLSEFIKDCNRRGTRLILTNVDKNIKDFVKRIGVSPLKRYKTAPTLKEGIDKAYKIIKEIRKEELEMQGGTVAQSNK